MTQPPVDAKSSRPPTTTLEWQDQAQNNKRAVQTRDYEERHHRLDVCKAADQHAAYAAKTIDY
jgi:hypothetical protein